MTYLRIRTKPITAYIALDGEMTRDDTARPIRFNDGGLGFEFQDEGIAMRVFDPEQLDYEFPNHVARRIAYVSVNGSADGDYIVNCPFKEAWGLSTVVGEEAFIETR